MNKLFILILCLLFFSSANAADAFHATNEKRLKIGYNAPKTKVSYNYDDIHSANKHHEPNELDELFNIGENSSVMENFDDNGGSDVHLNSEGSYNLITKSDDSEIHNDDQNKKIDVENLDSKSNQEKSDNLGNKDAIKNQENTIENGSESQKIEEQKATEEKLAREKAEREESIRIENARIENERLEAERLEKEKLENEKKERLKVGNGQNLIGSDDKIAQKEIDIPKETEPKKESVIDKMKNLFVGKKDDVIVGDIGVKNDNLKKDAGVVPSNIKVVDKTGKNTKAVRINAYTAKNDSVDKNHHAHIKIKKKMKKDDEFNYIDEDFNNQMININYDGEYENKIYEYNRKKIRIINDYKIKANVPEFLKHKENSLGNGHLNKIYSQDDYVSTLFTAVLDENLAAIDALLNIVKNNDVTNHYGETLLTYALKNKKEKAVRYLLMRGCNPNLRNKHGEDAKSLAISAGYRNIFSTLKQS